eukprot:c22679_g2_i1 orf=492-758(-)
MKKKCMKLQNEMPTKVNLFQNDTNCISGSLYQNTGTHRGPPQYEMLHEQCHNQKVDNLSDSVRVPIAQARAHKKLILTIQRLYSQLSF